MKSSKHKFKRLFDPIQIRGVTLKNRILMPAMTTNFAYRDGRISPRLIDYYERRALGGAGLIIVEPACVDYPCGKGLINQLDISTDDVIGKFQSLTRVVKAAGTRVAIQLHHAGSLRLLAEPIAVPPVAPSILNYRGFDTPQAADAEQIAKIVRQFVDAAGRAQRAGFDAVEFHGAHGYLISQFLSSVTNHRADEYGGSLENRMRFFQQIIARTRETVGQDFPIICRLNADEYRENGITIKDSQKIAQGLASAGADAINVSIDSTPAKSKREIMSNVPPMGFADATWVHLAADIKKAVTIPVIAVGRIHCPQLAEEILIQGKADLIAVGRGLIAEPDWPAKVARGLLDEIRPCISCNTCIRQVTRRMQDAVCAVNPLMGREKALAFSPARKQKRVLILGGGPGGMTAAQLAAARGHQVEIWEKAARLGGQLSAAAVPPGKDRIGRLADFCISQITKAGVQVRLNADWQDEEIRQWAPDAIVVAAGSHIVKPAIDGMADEMILTARQVLNGEAKVGRRVLIVGAGAVGCETADFLISKECSLTLVEQKSQVAQEMDIIRRRLLLSRLHAAGIDLRLNTRLLKILSTGGVVAGPDGNRSTIEADTIVLATEPQANREVLSAVRKLCLETYIIGDALKPRSIQEAVFDGYAVGGRL